MDAERWRCIKDLYFAVLDKDRSSREAHLADIRAREPELAELIGVLVESGGNSGLLDDPSSLFAALLPGASAPSRAFTPGELIAGRFTITRYIAGGGMGEVYEASDSQLRERVALKTIRPDIASNTAILEQFKKEVRRSRQIASRHVCRVHDFFTHQSDAGEAIAFFSMKLLEGETLAERLRGSGPLPIGDVLEIAREVGEGLQSAHRERLVHGDMKTSNVLLTGSGAVITDFGLARRVPLENGLLESDVDPFSGGTPAYMAPEQVSGLAPTPASDIYSFGLVLYEAVTGRLPFEGPNSLAVSTMRLHTDPASPRTFVPDLPLHWERTLLKCLERDPAKRFAAAQDVVHALEAPPPRARGVLRRAGIPIFGALVAISIAIASFSWIALRSQAPRGSIAVLPFENLAAAPERGYFSDAFTDELTHELSRSTTLRVMGRDSSSRFRQSGLAPAEVGRRLGVEYILAGSVQRLEGQLRMIVRLVNVKDGFQVWSHDYARSERDLYAVRNQIVREVGQSLHLSLASFQEPAQLTAAGLDVRDLYWMGRFHWKQRTRTALLTSVSYFEKAIGQDPRFAPAYSGLADAYCVLGEGADLPPAQAFEAAKRAALTALSIDGRLAEAYVPLAQVASLYDRDFAQAERHFRRAIELDPKLVSAHQWYGYMLVKQRRFQEALDQARLALESEPLSLPANNNLAVLYWYSGNDDQAVRQCRKVGELDDRMTFHHLIMAEIFARKGLTGEALAEMDRVRPEANESAMTVRVWAELNAILGRRAEAEGRIAQLLALRAKGGAAPSFVAAAYASIDDRDHAFEWIERAIAEHDGFISMMDVYPAFEPIRSDGRYRPLLERLGITARTGSGSTPAR